MFMHHNPFTTDLAQANGQAKLELDSLPAGLGPGTPHEGNGKGDIIAGSDVHLVEIEDYGSSAHEKKTSHVFLYASIPLDTKGGGTSNITMSGEWLATIPSTSFSRTALAQLSSSSRIVASSVVLSLMPLILELRWMAVAALLQRSLPLITRR